MRPQQAGEDRWILQRFARHRHWCMNAQPARHLGLALQSRRLRQALSRRVLMARKRRSYSVDFRAEAVRLVLERESDPNTCALRAWHPGEFRVALGQAGPAQRWSGLVQHADDRGALGVGSLVAWDSAPQAEAGERKTAAAFFAKEMPCPALGLSFRKRPLFR